MSSTTHPIPPALFRQVLGTWASGVTIVTSRHGDRVQGMTVSAFSSVSLDPPLVLVCADHTSNTHGLIEMSRVFSVSLLADGQQVISNRFASKKEEDRRFEGLDCPIGKTGCPRIPDAAAWLDCEVIQSVEAGDHVVYIGEVLAADVTEREVLLHLRSQYGTFCATS